MRKSQIFQIMFGTWALIFTVFGIYVYSVASGPDFDIEMVRPITSKLSPQFLDQALNFYPHWPAWFHSGSKLVQVDEHGVEVPKSQQKLQTGAYLRLGIDTKRLHGKYDVTLLVKEYTPQKRLILRVVADTKNSLTRMFDPLDWKIEFTPVPGGTLVMGTATAHTHSWRARVFGKFVSTILLNQVFYPNVMVLAEINDPNVVFPQADDEHGSM